MDAKKLGAKLKIAREDLGLTQIQLADKIKVKQKRISRYENGIVLPALDTMVKLAKALKKPTSHFIDE